jgi:hypothetical protein
LTSIKTLAMWALIEARRRRRRVHQSKETIMQRRSFVAAVLAAPLFGGAAFAVDLPRMAVAKSPSCGCCGAWVNHMRAAGFEVEVQDVTDDALSAQERGLGLAPEHTSCHTAEVEGYVVEGHVPSEDVKRLLAERPDARRLAVPRMPIGSSGMEMDDMRDPYDTLLIGTDGQATVFARH